MLGNAFFGEGSIAATILADVHLELSKSASERWLVDDIIWPGIINRD